MALETLQGDFFVPSPRDAASVPGRQASCRVGAISGHQRIAGELMSLYGVDL